MFKTCGCFFVAVSAWHSVFVDPLPPDALARLQGHQKPIRHLAFRPDARRLLSSDGGSSWPVTDVVTWDTGDWKRVAARRSSDLKVKGHLLFTSADLSRCVAWLLGGQVVVQDLHTGKTVYELADKFEAFNYPHGVFSQDSCFLMLKRRDVFDEDRRWVNDIIDLTRGKVLCTVPVGRGIGCFTTAADRSKVSWCTDGSVHVLEVAGAREQVLGQARNVGNRLGVPALALSADSRYLASCDPEDSIVHVWDLKTGKIHRVFPGKAVAEQPGKGACLAFSPDGKMLAVGGVGRGDDVELWEIATAKLRRRLSGHSAMVTAFAFSADGRLLASGSEATTVLVWDVWGLGKR
jgi:WD40 repeat protein